jgi:hypothetical protein
MSMALYEEQRKSMSKQKNDGMEWRERRGERRGERRRGEERGGEERRGEERRGEERN